MNALLAVQHVNYCLSLNIGIYSNETLTLVCVCVSPPTKHTDQSVEVANAATMT